MHGCLKQEAGRGRETGLTVRSGAGRRAAVTSTPATTAAAAPHSPRKRGSGGDLTHVQQTSSTPPPAATNDWRGMHNNQDLTKTAVSPRTSPLIRRLVSWLPPQNSPSPQSLGSHHECRLDSPCAASSSSHPLTSCIHCPGREVGAALLVVQHDISHLLLPCGCLPPHSFNHSCNR